MADLSKLAQAGDDCESCKSFWVGRQKKRPRKMVALVGVKTDGGTPIIICPYCDGQPLLTRNGQ